MKFEYADIVVHRDAGVDDGDKDDEDVLHTSISVDILSIPSKSLVDATKYCLMSMTGVEIPSQASGLEFPDSATVSQFIF